MPDNASPKDETQYFVTIYEDDFSTVKKRIPVPFKVKREDFALSMSVNQHEETLEVLREIVPLVKANKQKIDNHCQAHESFWKVCKYTGMVLGVLTAGFALMVAASHIMRAIGGQ